MSMGFLSRLSIILGSQLRRERFPSLRQWVDKRVMEEGVVAVSPWKLVGSDTKVFHGNELRSLVVLPVFNLLQICIDHREDDGRTGHKEEDPLPEKRVGMMSMTCCCRGHGSETACSQDRLPSQFRYDHLQERMKVTLCLISLLIKNKNNGLTLVLIRG